MSINTLTALAVARNDRTPTKSDAGEVTEDSSESKEKAGLPQLLVKQVPTELVALYTALTAGLVELVDEPTRAVPRPDELLGFRWTALVALVVASLALTYVSYRNKAEDGARQPVAELVGVGAAALGWGLVLPESPLLVMLDGDQGMAFVLVATFVFGAVNTVVATRLKKKASKRVKATPATGVRQG